MAKIFISYRREDGIAQTGRIYDRLVARMGETEVFMDLGKISAGADFVQALDEQLASCEVFIAVIGPRWLVSRKGRRRLDDADDFVRREIAAALARGIRILPVLIGGARMPNPSELPPDLAGLVKRNAVTVRDDRFDSDMDSLILDIEDPDRRPEDTLMHRLQGLRLQIQQRRKSVLVGAAIVLATALASWTDFFDFFTLNTRLNSLTLLLGDMFRQPIPNENVVLIGIDQRTEHALRQGFDRAWRRHHSVLVRRLAGAHARAIAFDMYFEEPSAFDAPLIAAISEARSKGTQVYVGMRAAAEAAPRFIPGLREVISGAGSLCIGDRLGYATTAPLFIAQRKKTEGIITWEHKRFGLGVLAALGPFNSIALDRSERELLVPIHDGVRQIRVGATETIQSPQSTCADLRKDDESASLFIRLSGAEHWRTAPRRVRYEDIVLAADDFESTPFARSFRDKTVLVGVTGIKTLPDQHSVLYRFAAEERYGVELHADVVSNLLSADQLHTPYWGVQLLLFIITVGMAGVVRLSTAQAPKVLRWAVVAAAILLYLLFAGFICAEYQVLLSCVYHLFAFAIAYWLIGKIHLPTER